MPKKKDLEQVQIFLANYAASSSPSSSIYLLPLLPSPAVAVAAGAGAASAATLVTHLPGFDGRLPFRFETGYVGVDEEKGVELFYYFVESEGRPRDDPLVLWLTGGPRCSAFSGLVFEIGPLKFVTAEYNGSLPSLVYFPYSWTKVSSIIFLDSPVGSGFSFSKQMEGYDVGDISSSMQVYTFIKKWFSDHPQFLSNPFYVAGDSYAGKVAPLIAQIISEGIESGQQPRLNLKGYLIGNPSTGEKYDNNYKVPYAHGMGIISDQLYELTQKNCLGEDYGNPHNRLCAQVLETVEELMDKVDKAQVLERKCILVSPKPEITSESRRYLKGENAKLSNPPEVPPLECRSYAYFLSYYWANDNRTREALNVKKGTVKEWVRCEKVLPYTKDLDSSIKYHYNLTRRGYRALAWIRSLNFSIVDDWRSWDVDGQAAGFTITYANNMTFATVKGGGHTAPEYRPKECLAMVRRWLNEKPL
uniref:Serine carboxypeptidase-like 18 n=1 Tax=Ananas comosus var. bracteatus TaxID=296719 RepID=A0A6V7NUT2_ANACO|nr:unnamed protein product [Ananas comosus var. bracteatus]